MSLLETIQPQPNFPKEDLTDSNADFLSLMLANPTMLKNGHTAAEKTHPLFSATHRSLAVAAENIFDASENIRALEYGIKTLEAMVLFVGADSLQPELTVLEGNFTLIMKPSNSEQVQKYFEQANADFLKETPRAAAVIAESSTRFVGTKTHLAIVGGAVARQFGLDNAKD